MIQGGGGLGLPHFHDSHTLMTSANGYPTRGTRPHPPAPRAGREPPVGAGVPSLRPFFTNPPRSGGMSRGGGNGSMPGGAYRACHGPQRQGCPRFWQASQALQNDFCSLTCS